MTFWVYILRCADGTYYTGHTDDLERRVGQHQTGEVPGYTHDRRPVELMWSQDFGTRIEALAAETQVKDWSRKKKEALFRGDWDAVSAGARKPQAVSRYGLSTSSIPTRDERIGEGSALNTATPPPVIVLVRPQLAENIGKAARAMLNFGLVELRLVAPRDGWPNPKAGPAASGADVVLARAQVFDSVAAAVADCAHVYATTVRKRELVLPVITPEQAAREVRAAGERSAILFGAERAGLETDEAALAGKIVTVPINPAFRSLNLAQAVILFAYEWSKHEALAVPTEAAEEPRAPHAELEGLIGQLDAALDEAGYFFPPERAQASRRTIRTIMAKAGWSSREVRAVRGMIRALVSPRRR